MVEGSDEVVSRMEGSDKVMELMVELLAGVPVELWEKIIYLVYLP